jgi:hypothetical protein
MKSVERRTNSRENETEAICFERILTEIFVESDTQNYIIQ